MGNMNRYSRIGGQSDPGNFKAGSQSRPLFPASRPLVDFIRSTASTASTASTEIVEDNRKSVRLPAPVPLLYSFTPDDEKFHQCLAADVSMHGLCADLKDIYPAARRKYLAESKKIFFKVPLPGRGEMIRIKGLIRWIRPASEREPTQFKVGCEYTDLPQESRIEILHYGLSLVRRKFILTALFVVFAVGLVTAVTWGSIVKATELRTRQMLKSSELVRIGLLRERDRLGTEISGLKKTVLQNYSILADQRKSVQRLNRMIAAQETRLQEQNLVLKERAESISRKESQIDDLTRNLDQKTSFLRTVRHMMNEVGEEWDINDSERLVILDPAYDEGQTAFRAGEYPAAIAKFRSLVRKYPDSLLGYRLLYRALVLGGQTREAENIFTSYAARMKEILGRK